MSYEEPNECNDCVDYVHMISDGRAWTCVCCSLEEATFYIGKREGVFLWHRYMLRCGHQCHERCYRRWCFTENGVGCPTCGLLEKTQDNQFCRYCDQWGHSRLACPRLRLAAYRGSAKRVQVAAEASSDERS